MSSSYTTLRLSSRIRAGLKNAPADSQTFTAAECVLLAAALRWADAAFVFHGSPSVFQHEHTDYAKAFGEFKTEGP